MKLAIFVCASVIVAAAEGVEHYQTLSNGVKMPMLAFGVWQLNDTQLMDVIPVALTNGFSMLDLGQAYLNNRGVGRAVAKVIASGSRKREDLFIQAKVDGCGQNAVTPSAPTLKNCYNGTKASLEQQLVETNLTYVDSAIIHFPPSIVPPQGGCRIGACDLVRWQWKAAIEFYEAGKARAIGVSNYCKDCFQCLENFHTLPMIHQIQYHLGMGDDKYGYVTFAKERNMAIQAYSVLANKPSAFFWEPRGINRQILSGKAFDGMLGVIAKAHNRSSVQIALKWVLQQGFTTITKSSNPKHVKQDADVFDFTLTDEEMALLNYEVPNSPKAGADHGLHGTPSWACHFPDSRPGLVV